jgi:hypothetical protein
MKNPFRYFNSSPEGDPPRDADMYIYIRYPLSLNGVNTPRKSLNRS